MLVVHDPLVDDTRVIQLGGLDHVLFHLFGGGDARQGGQADGAEELHDVGGHAWRETDRW